MKKNWSLLSGLIILSIGIVLKIFTQSSPLPLLIILTGVGLKVYFVFTRIRSFDYRPGYELLLLLFGLILFFTGIYLRNNDCSLNPIWFIASGILLKTGYIFMFIRKSGGI